jgi:hypothetical protein
MLYETVKDNEGHGGNKMKQSKWLKWKVGIVGALSLTILFHEVKASPAFEKAKAIVINDKAANTASNQDIVMNDFTSSVTLPNNNSAIQDSQSNPLDTSNQKSHTQTGRS